MTFKEALEKALAGERKFVADQKDVPACNFFEPDRRNASESEFLDRKNYLMACAQRGISISAACQSIHELWNARHSEREKYIEANRHERCGCGMAAIYGIIERIAHQVSRHAPFSDDPRPDAPGAATTTATDAGVIYRTGGTDSTGTGTGAEVPF